MVLMKSFLFTRSTDSHVPGSPMLSSCGSSQLIETELLGKGRSETVDALSTDAAGAQQELFHAAGTARLIVQDVAAAIQFKMAAVKQLLLESFSGALHPRFCSRKRESQALTELFLGEAMILRQDEGLPVLGGEVIHHGTHAGQQLAHDVVVGKMLRQCQILCRRPGSVVRRWLR